MERRGSKPGEYRGGRKKGTPNRNTVNRLTQTIESVKVTVDRVLQEYACIAFLDIGEAFDDEGQLLPIRKMPTSVRRALAGVEVSELMVDGDGKGPVGKIHKIKIIEKTKALDSIARHLGMFIDRVQSEVTVISNRETLQRELDERRARRLSAGT